MSRTAAGGQPRRPRLARRTSAVRELRLFDRLAAEPTAEGCAGVALSWLRRHAAIRKGVCLLSVVGQRRLAVAACLGVDQVLAQDFHLDLTAIQDPLVRV